MSSFCFYPIQYPCLHALYEKQEQNLWVPSEIEFSEDRNEWENLDPETKTFLTNVLAFFSFADGIVCENLMSNFKKELSFIKEASHFFAIQEYVETIHNQVYSLFIEAFISDSNEKNKLFNSIQDLASVKSLSEWILKWLDPKIPLGLRIIAFACIEGIFFQSSFVAIYWIKKRNILKGLSKANEWVARDEAIHLQFAIQLFKILSQEPLKGEIVNIIKESVDVISEFIKTSLKSELIGMNSKDLILYTQSEADALLKCLNIEPIYNTSHPFDWMVNIGLSNKSNFFECPVSEYKTPTVNLVEKDFKIDIDF